MTSGQRCSLLNINGGGVPGNLDIRCRRSWWVSDRQPRHNEKCGFSGFFFMNEGTTSIESSVAIDCW